jgi:hypothetical protein
MPSAVSKLEEMVLDALCDREMPGEEQDDDEEANVVVLARADSATGLRSAAAERRRISCCCEAISRYLARLTRARKDKTTRREWLPSTGWRRSECK